MAETQDGAVPGAGGRRRLEVRPLLVGEEERWEALMREHHYLGYRSLVGETLRYVGEEDGHWVGLLSWSTAAFKCGVRDRWIGWSKSQQWRRLRYVANNSRFLVLPQTRRQNLASQLLAANLRRLAGDWEERHGHPVLLAETFVDQRFRGSCYLGAGWLQLGQTLGYGRNGGKYYHHGQPKTLLVKEVMSRGREWLAAPFDVPAMQPGGVPLDLNCAFAGAGSLLDALERIPDPRHRRGIRHRQDSMLALAVCGVLSGARSVAALGEWAADLPPEALQRLQCRWHPQLKRYIAPSGVTLWRLLRQVPPEELEDVVGQWLAAQVTGVGAVAMDGKTVRGAKGEGGALQLLAAMAHDQGVVLHQRKVADKQNEIPVAREVIKKLDLKGKMVTLDALHTQRETAQLLLDQGADYMLTVKGNQPQLQAALELIPDSSFSPSAGHHGQGPRAAGGAPLQEH